MNTYQIHVDTASQQKIAGTQAMVNKTNGNPFQCTVMLGNRHRTLTSIALKNAQIPIGYTNIRAPYNTITINAVTYTVAPGNYNSSTFIAALNSSTDPNGNLMSAIGTWSFISSTSQTQFLSSIGSVTITLPTGLSYPTLANFLGFSSTQALTGSTITSQFSYIINFDTYISIWIENIGQSSLEPAQITFKLPVDVPNGSILFWADMKQNTQKVCVTDSAARVDRLNIKVLDRFGNQLNNNNIDWSFTLEIISDN